MLPSWYQNSSSLVNPVSSLEESTEHASLLSWSFARRALSLKPLLLGPNSGLSLEETVQIEW